MRPWEYALFARGSVVPFPRHRRDTGVDLAVQVPIDRPVLQLSVDRAPTDIPRDQRRQAALVSGRFLSSRVRNDSADAPGPSGRSATPLAIHTTQELVFFYQCASGKSLALADDESIGDESVEGRAPGAAPVPRTALIAWLASL